MQSLSYYKYFPVVNWRSRQLSYSHHTYESRQRARVTIQVMAKITLVAIAPVSRAT